MGLAAAYRVEMSVREDEISGKDPGCSADPGAAIEVEPNVPASV